MKAFQRGLSCLQWISSCEGSTVNMTAKVLNTVFVTNCSIFGPSSPLVFSALCFVTFYCLCGDAFWFSSAAANWVCVCLAFRQQPASVRQQRWNHCTQWHQAWKQVSGPDSDFLFLYHFLLYMFVLSFPLSVCCSLSSSFPLITSTSADWRYSYRCISELRGHSSLCFWACSNDWNVSRAHSFFIEVSSW